MWHNVSEEPAHLRHDCTLQCRIAYRDDELAGFCVYGPHTAMHLRNVRTLLPHSTAIPNVSKLNRYSRNIRYDEAQCVFCEVGTEFVILLK